MKVSDYIVEYLIHKEISDVFGYPGGMVTYLMDSFFKYRDKILAHVTYHEQGAAFAACGYAQASGKVGVAYATSGPGATNLITGICNAYFDSIPTLFITGQVNRSESKGKLSVRQRGFQETDIVSIVTSITKYAVYIDAPQRVPEELNKAFHIAMSGRKGPVLIDIPMNIFREDVDSILLDSNPVQRGMERFESVISEVSSALNHSLSPVVLIGGGIKLSDCEDKITEVVNQLDIPVISSMIAFDVIKENPHYYGFIGAYGSRIANFITAKSDLIISIGSRMDIRQVGHDRGKFAPDAKIIRFDIDQSELEYTVHKDEMQYCMEISEVIHVLENISVKDYSAWLHMCDTIKQLLSDTDMSDSKALMTKISINIPDNVIITTDVGQNQVWVAQSFQVKPNQKVLFSGGHGAMGYSLPAAIGAYYGSERKQVICITGDGGMQMNIQELQFIAREKIPIKIIVLNNHSLGMIRHFQEMYFDGRYYQTKPEGGYSAPDFCAIAKAYGIKSSRVEKMEEDLFEMEGPELLEVSLKENTYVFPKLEFGKPNQDQEPLLDRELYKKLMNMNVNDFR